MSKLYRETLCGHGLMKAHWLGPLSSRYLKYDVELKCPGGSRKEVTIDYERALLVKVSDPCDMDGKRDQINEWFTYRDIQAIVNAALEAHE